MGNLWKVVVPFFGFLVFQVLLPRFRSLLRRPHQPAFIRGPGKGSPGMSTFCLPHPARSVHQIGATESRLARRSRRLTPTRKKNTSSASICSADKNAFVFVLCAFFRRHYAALFPESFRRSRISRISRLTQFPMICQFLCSLCSLWLNSSQLTRFSVIFHAIRAIPEIRGQI